MFIILPTGHSATIRRIPWATASIVLICTAIQLASSLFGPSQKELARVETPLLAIEQAQRGQPPPPSSSPMKLPFFSTTEEKPKVPSDPKARAAMRDELEQKLETLQSHDVAQLLAYRDGSGFTLRLLTSAFAHDGWLHLIGNMLFLYLCGCNLEDRWGRTAFLAFYLVGALVSASCCAVLHRSDHAISLGASGAIAACMGAFLVFYARTEVSFFYALWISTRPRWGTFRAAAYWAGGLWLLLQLLDFWFESRGLATGVGYSGHVSGFLFGAFTAVGLKALGYDAKLQKAMEEPADWEENPEVAHALSLQHQGRDVEALAELKKLRATLPRDPTVMEELFLLGLRLEDSEAVEATASEFFVALLRRGEMVDALSQLEAMQKPFAQVALSDRALAGLAKAAFELQRNDLGVDLSKQLLATFPKSPIVPAALVEVGKAQLRAGKIERGRKTLEQVIARYPLDPFASEAEQLLKTAIILSPSGS